MDVLEKIKVCDLSALCAYEGRVALVEGQQVALFLIPNQGVFAVQNWDPIGKAFVLSRGIVGDVKGKLCVASPLYKQHFCLRSGECLENSDVRLTHWPVLLENDEVFLEWHAKA